MPFYLLPSILLNKSSNDIIWNVNIYMIDYWTADDSADVFSRFFKNTDDRFDDPGFTLTAVLLLPLGHHLPQRVFILHLVSKFLPADALARINTPSSATSLASYRTAFDDIPGSRNNPIVISDDDDDVCSRCRRPGHTRSDCETPIRSFIHCETCHWLRRPQADCDHYDVSPGWAKRQQRRIDERDNRT
jgi:hypothetical protein